MFTNQNTIALVYDFDGTLIPKTMQEYTILPKLKISSKRFWAAILKESRMTDGEIMMIYMRQLINHANSITINPQKILGITKTSSLLLVSNIENLKNTFSTGLPYISSKSNVLDRGELGIQGSRPAEVIKLWLGLRFLGMKGIEDILQSSIDRKVFFENNLSSKKYEIYSGPLHIISFLPKGMKINESNSWTQINRIKLLKNNFMLSRPKFKGKYFLRAVMGNYNTSESHIVELLKILNSI